MKYFVVPKWVWWEIIPIMYARERVYIYECYTIRNVQNATSRTWNHNAYDDTGAFMDKHKVQVCKTPDFRAKGATGSMPTKAPRASPRNAQSFPSEAAVVLCPAALARFLSIWVDLFPRSPPPHTRRCSSYLSELSPPNAISTQQSNQQRQKLTSWPWQH